MVEESHNDPSSRAPGCREREEGEEEDGSDIWRGLRYFVYRPK